MDHSLKHRYIIYHTICFHHQVKAEDRGVERAAALAADERVRIAASDTIEALLETDFRLIINDTEYYVKTPAQVSPFFLGTRKIISHIITGRSFICVDIFNRSNSVYLPPLHS